MSNKLLTTEELFDLSISKINNIKNITICDDDKLYLYGYYKQAKNGDCKIEKPFFYKITDNKKYLAWKEREGINKDLAMKCYIKKVKQLLEK